MAYQMLRMHLTIRLLHLVEGARILHGGDAVIEHRELGRLRRLRRLRRLQAGLHSGLHAGLHSGLHAGLHRLLLPLPLHQVVHAVGALGLGNAVLQVLLYDAAAHGEGAGGEEIMPPPTGRCELTAIDMPSLLDCPPPRALHSFIGCTIMLPFWLTDVSMDGGL